MTTDSKKKPTEEEKFKRDGARYVCRRCKAKYFTREEVEKCFDAHNAAPTPGAN